MKKNVASKILAGTLASAMVLGMAACGDNSSSNSSSPSNSTPSSNTPSSNNTPSSSNSDAQQESSNGGEAAGGEVDYMAMEPMKLVISLPGDYDHYSPENAPDPMFDKLVADINERFNVDITWEWDSIATYYNRLGLKYASGDIADILVVGTNASFWSAAEGGSYDTPELDADGNPVMQDKKDENGNPVLDKDGNVVQEQVMTTIQLSDPMFWDLTDYIQDYDNLATIPTGRLDEISLNGKYYALPRSRPVGRFGWGYRRDWLNNLGLKEPETWDDFAKMLHEFTYGDPDGNGEDDTVGLVLDTWGQVYDVMGAWFGVPNTWGLDDKDQLVYYAMTDEYKAFLKAMRDLYADGVINIGQNGNSNFEELGAGKATTEVRNGKGGVAVQVLDDLRKVETRMRTDREELNIAAVDVEEVVDADGNVTTPARTAGDEDDLYFTLRGWVLTDSGKNQPLVLLNGATTNAIAISNVGNVKTEEDLKRALWVLNKFNDGEILNLIEYGWEGVTFELQDGYVVKYDGDAWAGKREEQGIKTMKYNDAFNQIPLYYTAEANERPYTTAPAVDLINRIEDEQKLVKNVPYVVDNKGAGFTSKTYVDMGTALDQIIWDARLKYIKGEIDDAGLESELNRWLTAGGQQVTDEMNEARNKTK